MLRDPASAARLGPAEAVERRSALPSIAELDRQMVAATTRKKPSLFLCWSRFLHQFSFSYFSSKLVHKSTNTGLGSTTSAPPRWRHRRQRTRGAGRYEPGQRAKGVPEPKNRQGGVVRETSQTPRNGYHDSAHPTRFLCSALFLRFLECPSFMFSYTGHLGLLGKLCFSVSLNVSP